MNDRDVYNFVKLFAGLMHIKLYQINVIFNDLKFVHLEKLQFVNIVAYWRKMSTSKIFKIYKFISAYYKTITTVIPL